MSNLKNYGFLFAVLMVIGITIYFISGYMAGTLHISDFNAQNMILSVLCYFGWLLLPLLAERKAEQIVVFTSSLIMLGYHLIIDCSAITGKLLSGALLRALALINLPYSALKSLANADLYASHRLLFSLYRYGVNFLIFLLFLFNVNCLLKKWNLTDKTKFVMPTIDIVLIIFKLAAMLLI